MARPTAHMHVLSQGSQSDDERQRLTQQHGDSGQGCESWLASAGGEPGVCPAQQAEQRRGMQAAGLPLLGGKLCPGRPVCREAETWEVNSQGSLGMASRQS